jgi:hypothetical protein
MQAGCSGTHPTHLCPVKLVRWVHRAGFDVSNVARQAGCSGTQATHLCQARQEEARVLCDMEAGMLGQGPLWVPKPVQPDR